MNRVAIVISVLETILRFLWNLAAFRREAVEAIFAARAAYKEVLNDLRDGDLTEEEVKRIKEKIVKAADETEDVIALLGKVLFK